MAQRKHTGSRISHSCIRQASRLPQVLPLASGTIPPVPEGPELLFTHWSICISHDMNTPATGPQKCFQTIASNRVESNLEVKFEHSCVFAYHSLTEKQHLLLAKACIRSVCAFRHSPLQNGVHLLGCQRFNSDISWIKFFLPPQIMHIN